MSHERRRTEEATAELSDGALALKMRQIAIGMHKSEDRQKVKPLLLEAAKRLDEPKPTRRARRAVPPPAMQEDAVDA